MSRQARLVLCTADGTVLGALPPVEVATPWHPDVEAVVAAVRRVHGVGCMVLRLLDADGPPGSTGGRVTYLAELTGATPTGPLEPVTDAELQAVPDHPLRSPWARPGGLAAILDWADAALEEAGRPRCGGATQVKTWNLSSVVRLPTPGGPVWCKSVPPFFAHEAQVISMLGADDPALVPTVLATDAATGTALLDDIPGEDQFGAPEERLVAMVQELVRLQDRWAGRVDTLVGAGLPDWRAGALAPRLQALLERPSVRAQVAPGELAAVDMTLADLPARFEALAACGLPDTLVHGDFHAGNWRWDGRRLVLIDWGDSGVGHPLLDQAAFLAQVPEGARPAILRAWAQAWRGARPDAEPERALHLVLPIAALRQALLYQDFLDAIEPTERRYHEIDVPQWLSQAATA